MLNCLGVAAHHQAVPAVFAPHPARRSAVDEVNAALTQRRGVTDVVAVVAVSAINHHVALVEQGTK